jgi:hypothetical protein
MAVIDQETEAKNKTVDTSKEEQFKENEAAGLARQKTIDDTTAGVQKTLDQMREEARIAREAGRQSPEDRAKERDQQVAAAQAEFDAAVETANAAKPQEPTPSQRAWSSASRDAESAEARRLKVPKVEVDGIKDPKLKPPKKKDLKLGLDRSAKDSMDRFSDGPEEPTEKTEAAGNFDSRGLGLGSGASLIPVIEPPDQKDKADPDGVDADVNAGADANDPELDVPEVEPELGLQPMDAEVSSTRGFHRADGTDQEPSLNLESIMASFAAVRVRLEEFDAASIAKRCAAADATSRWRRPLGRCEASHHSNR